MDAFQATFLVLIRKSRTLWVRESLGPWLHRVACRAAGRVKRDSARQRRIELRVAERTLADTVAIPHPSHRDELALVLHEEVDRLPDRLRLAILLCDLEGRTCEEAARILACPVGTVASRLARGRGRLRTRLARRGIAPLGPALAAAFSRETAGATLPASLRESTIRVALGYATTRTALGVLAPSTASLANAVSRSLLMTQLRSLTTPLLCTGCLALAAISAIRALAYSPQPQQPRVERSTAQQKPDEPVKPAVVAAPRFEDKPFVLAFDQAHKDFLLSKVGNMRPLIRDENGLIFQSRIAILYKDGTVKLYRWESKDPVAPPLRHKAPIREFGFIAQFKLLITTSDDSVKIWDALSGALRKELDGEVMLPLAFTSISTCAEPSPGPFRFVTIDPSGRVITTWDARTLEQVGKFRPEGMPRLLGAGLTRDGNTLATIAADHSVTIWSPTTNKPLATFFDPSPVVAHCFADDVMSLKKPVLKLYDDFWNLVAPLVPPRAAATPPAK